MNSGLHFQIDRLSRFRWLLHYFPVNGRTRMWQFWALTPRHAKARGRRHLTVWSPAMVLSAHDPLNGLGVERRLRP